MTKTQLYGIFEAKKAIRKKCDVIVEGYLDAMSSESRPKRNSSLPSTALTLAHLRQITQTTHFVYLVFDGDSAGKDATLKTLELSLDFPKHLFWQFLFLQAMILLAISKNGVDALKTC